MDDRRRSRKVYIAFKYSELFTRKVEWKVSTLSFERFTINFNRLYFESYKALSFFVTNYDKQDVEEYV